MLRARLRRLEQGLRRSEGAITIEGWCDLDGGPCQPPEGVRRSVEEQASGRWRWGVWVPDDPCGAIVVLLGEGDDLQVVEV